MGRDVDSGDLELERHRDRQQWILDYVIKISGREQNFEPDGRRFPPEVRSHDMIPRVMYRRGRQFERLARAADENGHGRTAISLYNQAIEEYRLGQHAIFEDDDPEKIYIYGRIDDCYDRIIALSPTPIERIDVPFEGSRLSGILHLVPGAEPRPLVLYCPGMDQTKEAFPTPGENLYLDRGMHVLTIDGPGQGSANLRKIRVTLDNYERGASALLDAVLDRPEIDAEQLAVTGVSMGSYWGMRVAATDPRVKVVATSVANYGSKRHIFERSSPRFKQVFMYMAGIHDEAEFDALAQHMTLFELAPQVTCPTLMVTGEYDPLSPVDEAVAVFDRVAGPKELWVVEDQFHNLRNAPQLGMLDSEVFVADWIGDALAGRAPKSDGRKVLIRTSNTGPYSDPVSSFKLPDRDGLTD